MALKSRMPVWDGLANDQFRYLEGLDRRIPYFAPLPLTATLTDLINRQNEMQAAWIAAGSMERQ